MYTATHMKWWGWGPEGVAFTHTDKLSMLTRPQCRLAGLGP